MSENARPDADSPPDTSATRDDVRHRAMEQAEATIQDPPAAGGIVGYFTSHPIGFWFFFWGEFAERCSYYGMRAILAKYMADQLSLGQDNAAVYSAYFLGACYFLPLIGGWIADNYIGKYWTIVGFSVPYILGHFILGFENYYALVFALALLAMGSGVIKPNISTLMGMTYDQQRPGQTKLRSDAFAIFYFAINVGAAISQFAMPPLRTSYGYAIAFMFPAILMAVSFLIFAAGKRYYAVETIERRETTPEERAERWRVLSRVFGLFFLVMFFWAIFDQASSTWIFFTEACMNRHILGFEMDADQMQFFNPVLILIMLPPITILFRYLDHKGIRIRATDKIGVGFVLTAGCMGIMALAAALAGDAELRPGMVTSHERGSFEVVVSSSSSSGVDVKAAKPEKARIDATSQKSAVVSYDTAEGSGRVTFTGDGVVKLVPVEQDGKVNEVRVDGRFAKVELEFTPKDAKEPTKSTIEGNVSAMVRGELDVERRWFVDPAKQVTVWWLVLAYIVITVAEVLISVTGLELAYTAAPKSMTGFVTACWLLTVSLANYLINAPITKYYTRLQPLTYFGMLTAIMVVVSIAFVFVANRFNRRQAELESQVG